MEQRISIWGRSYRLRGGDTDLQPLARQVEERLLKLSQGTGRQPLDVAILVALNLMAELHEARQSAGPGVPAREVDAALASIDKLEEMVRQLAASRVS